MRKLDQPGAVVARIRGCFRHAACRARRQSVRRGSRLGRRRGLAGVRAGAAVRRLPPGVAAAGLGAGCSSEMASKMPAIRSVVTMDEPPCEMSGSGMPVRGIALTTPPMLNSVWMPRHAVSPVATHEAYALLARAATRIPETISATYRSRSAAHPMKPSSSPMKASASIREQSI